MPGSPESSTTWPSPVFALDQRRSSSSISSSRPTRAVRPVACSASKRLSTELARSAAQARTGPAMPLRSFAPRSSSSKRLPRSFRVLSAMTTVFGSAIPCRRAARFGVSPTMPRSCALPRSDQVADHDQPGRNADTGLQRSARPQAQPPLRSVPARPVPLARRRPHGPADIQNTRAHRRPSICATNPSKRRTVSATHF